MKSYVRQALAVVALSSLCLAQPFPSEAAHKAAKKKAVAAKSASQEELKQLKEALDAQQKRLNALEQQNATLDQKLQQNEQKLDSTQQQLVEAQNAARDAQQKAGAVETEKSAVESLQSDMADVKTTLTNAANTTQEEQKRVNGVESMLSRFRMSGDVRVRYENFTQSKNDPANAANHDFERNRPRVRVRFGIDGKLNQDFVGGIAIATGAANDPTSPNQTLGDSLIRKPINLDRGYVTYNPHYLKGLSITGGKFAFNWQKTNQTFDPDINPDGFSERYSFDVKNNVVKNFTLFAMQMYLNELNTQSVGKNSEDSWAVGGGAQAKLQLGKFWTMTPSYTIVDFITPNFAVNGSATTANNGGTPNYYGGFKVGSTGFAPNGMTNCITNKTQYGASAAAFCSDFLYSDIIVNNQIKTGIDKLPFNLLVEFEQNLNATKSNGGASFFFVNAKTAANKKRDKLYVVDASLGQVKNKGDFQFGYSFIHAEQDAVMASFAESDQFQPTNALDHKIYFNYRVAHNTTLGYTQWIGRYLDFNLTPSTFTRNTNLYRGQADIIYTF